MPSVEVSIPYQIPQDQALRRIKAYVERMKAQYASQVNDFEESWNGNTGNFSGSTMGMSVSATLTVNPGAVTVDVDLPFAATFFSGKIESAVRSELGKILA